MFLMKRRTRRAFTLIELLIVVLIIGILAIVAYIGYAGYSSRAKASEARSAIGDVKKLVETDFASSGVSYAGSAYSRWGDRVSGKYYDDFTINGACDQNNGRFAGTITAHARAGGGAPDGLAITYAVDGTSTEVGWP